MNTFYDVPSCTWTGKSGMQYTFRIYSIHSLPSNLMGMIYVFCDILSDGRVFAIYVGRTKNGEDRWNGHDKWQEAINKYQMTHIGILEESSEYNRSRIEIDLITRLNPPLNDQHNGGQHKESGGFFSLKEVQLDSRGNKLASFLSNQNSPPNFQSRNKLLELAGALSGGDSN